tara:strand:+ start:2601 stop:3293 length:693 start_codon:yes stop_codon:yes gene_type:complete
MQNLEVITSIEKALLSEGNYRFAAEFTKARKKIQQAKSDAMFVKQQDTAPTPVATQMQTMTQQPQQSAPLGEATIDLLSRITKLASPVKKPMKMGGTEGFASPQSTAPRINQPGFIGTEPENVSKEATVADDVPVDVPSGTFVLNAPAVEFMGSSDVKEMIINALEEAEQQGVDISARNDKISKEDYVALLVSRGEVLIPPELAKIIGYDRLEKINNRGKKEVQKRAKQS